MNDKVYSWYNESSGMGTADVWGRPSGAEADVIAKFEEYVFDRDDQIYIVELVRIKSSCPKMTVGFTQL